jgi:hypothetical protein
MYVNNLFHATGFFTKKYTSTKPYLTEKGFSNGSSANYNSSFATYVLK